MLRALLLVLIVHAAQAATVYRVVHPDGRVEYSDEPLPGATVMELPDYPSPDLPPPAATTPPAPATPVENAPSKQALTSYRSLRVIQPEDDATVFFDAVGLPVEISLDPPLRSGDVVAVELDGDVVARGSQTRFTLPEVYRGTHTLSARVMDATGKVLVHSKAIKFHLIQHSILKGQ